MPSAQSAAGDDVVMDTSHADPAEEEENSLSTANDDSTDKDKPERKKPRTSVGRPAEKTKVLFLAMERVRMRME
jgi:hypothetical protein